VVAQLSTEHRLTKDLKYPIGHVPRVNFVGTRFENLRIGGFPVEVELDLAFCGPRPDGNRSYLQDGSFLDRVQRQLDGIVKSEDLPEGLEKRYGAEITYIDDLKRRAKEGADGGSNGYSKLRCSLVKNIKLPIEIPGVRTFGNAVFIRDFGTVYLAELEVGLSQGHNNSPHWKSAGAPPQANHSNYFTLNMLDVRLGCPVAGSNQAAKVVGNGQSYP
jgi:hypothetical protein